MQSLKELYKVGPGPSSSHTLGPKRACDLYLKRYHKEIDQVIVELYGSLSLTGKGHYTDYIILECFKDYNPQVLFKLDWDYDFDNGLIIKGYKDSVLIKEWVVYSVGGGSIEILNENYNFNKEVYPQKDFKEIESYCNSVNNDLLTYVLDHEKDILSYLDDIFEAMIASVENGLLGEGYLKGTLKVKKVAKELILKARNTNDNNLKLMAYAFATNEENAMGNTVVTAPTLGSCGVLASLVYNLYHDLNYPKDKIVKGLAVAGVFGNIIKQNATISGAVGGCQAEIGVACAMGSALMSYVNDLSFKEIEYAAEMGIEHHLGLTCDPIGGYVIIPCIERNAVASVRCVDNYNLSKNLFNIKSNLIDFDTIIKTMNFTGSKIPIELKETSLGGLAKEYKCHE